MVGGRDAQRHGARGLPLGVVLVVPLRLVDRAAGVVELPLQGVALGPRLVAFASRLVQFAAQLVPSQGFFTLSGKWLRSKAWKKGWLFGRGRCIKWRVERSEAAVPHLEGGRVLEVDRPTHAADCIA